MTLPGVHLLVAFADGAFAQQPRWEDISSYLMDVSITRGRQFELDRVEAGRAVLVLRNTSGNFWPAYSSGDYYPDVKPGKMLCVRATYPKTLLFDNFRNYWERPATSLYYTLTGQVWTAGQGTWQIEGLEDFGKASCTTYTQHDHVTADAGAANVVIRCDVTWDAGSEPYILFRSDGGFLNADRVGFDFAGNLKIFLNSGLDSVAGFAVDDTTYTFRIECNGTSIKVYVDDVLKFTKTENAFLTNTKVGFYLALTTAPLATYWDNLSVQAYAASTTAPALYEVFNGVIAAWDHRYELAGGQFAAVRVTAIDAMKVLSNSLLNVAGYAQETSDTRIQNVLTDLGWALNRVKLSAGQLTIQASGALVNANALTHLQAVEASEDGLFFVGADGRATFQDRDYRAGLSSQATYGDSGDLPYESVTLDHSDVHVLNDVRYTRVGGSEQTASDATSQTDYGLRSTSRTDLLHIADADTLASAERIRDRYKQAQFRVRSITIRPEDQPADEWPDVLGFDLSTRVTIKNDQAHASIDADYYIEQIQHVANGRLGTWLTTWALSPV